ncbi:hypothetical protein P3S67_005810 [Capsicum chacoense]
MKNFIVVPNRSKIKTNKYTIKFLFTHRTTIRKIDDARFDQAIFKFCSFEDLINPVDVDENKLFDVVGEIVAYGPVQEHKQGNKSTFKITRIK